MFHATWASPKWFARWAAWTESLEDDVQTSPRHPSSISHVGDGHMPEPRLPLQEMPLVSSVTQAPINARADPHLPVRRSSGHTHNNAVPHTRGPRPERPIHATFPILPNDLLGERQCDFAHPFEPTHEPPDTQSGACHTAWAQKGWPGKREGGIFGNRGHSKQRGPLSAKGNPQSQVYEIRRQSRQTTIERPIGAATWGQ